ncbi:hypothetical protein TSOC_008717, partial [Tetrabaena socialis]
MTGCPQFAGYSVTADADHNGDDIGRYSFSNGDAANRCNVDPSCVGFNSDGWMKTSVSNPVRWPGYCLYTKRATGDDIGSQAFSDPVAKCNADSTCLGFNNAGWYKYAITPNRAVPGMCLYARNNVETSKFQIEHPPDAQAWL